MTTISDLRRVTGGGILTPVTLLPNLKRGDRVLIAGGLGYGREGTVMGWHLPGASVKVFTDDGPIIKNLSELAEPRRV